jgi:glycosyltransferase involved in cell wall biosynthesis
MQAMASGLPIVGVRARGLPEYINNRNGFIVEPDNAQAMANAIIPLLKNLAAAKKLGKSARAYVEQFSETAIAERWEKIYEGAIKDYTKKAST